LAAADRDQQPLVGRLLARKRGRLATALVSVLSLAFAAGELPG